MDKVQLPDNLKDLANLAYSTFVSHMPTTPEGFPAPPVWEALPDDIKLAWESVANEIYMQFVRGLQQAIDASQQNL